MAKNKNFFDAEFEIELLNLQMQAMQKEQKTLNWILGVLAGLLIGILAYIV